ncbi:MAG: hypothetical protein QM723_01440 [Myxococcaceae bacterium]
MKKILAAVLCLAAASAWAENCKDAAKNMGPLMAIAIKGMEAKEAELKSTAAEAEKKWAAKCAAAPDADKNGKVVACLAKAKTLGDFDKCKASKTPPDKWADDVVAELKK